MKKRARIYLDNAATTWPKPQGVYDAVDHYQRALGAAVGRGGYVEAEEAGKAVEQARAKLANLIGAESPERIIFAFNGTDALNLAIHGTLEAGDHVVTTVVEHNSVLRPLRWLEDRGRIQVTRVDCDDRGFVQPCAIEEAIKSNTKLIVLIHASNVVGAIQPAKEIGEIAKKRGTLLLLDAAQTIGHIPVDVNELQADFVAAAGHKGLLGPLGTGFLYIRTGRDTFVKSTRQGGTGSASSEDRQPRTLPQKYESGNHNAPGLIGLQAGLEYLTHRGIADVQLHSETLTRRLLDGLSAISRVKIYGPQNESQQIGVVSINLDGLKATEVAAALDAKYAIQTRAGFQCAALLHQRLNTLHLGGTVRFSIGPFNTEADIDAAIEAVSEISRSSVSSPIQKVHCPCVEGETIDDSGESPGSKRVLAARYGPLSPKVASADQGTPSISALLPGLEELWDLTCGDPEVTIAILDGPVDQSHPSIQAANLTYLGDNPPTSEPAGHAVSHGTHVASIIFGQHGSDIHGIAPQCRGLIRPIYRDAPDGALVNATQQELAAAIQEALAAGANVINISGGEPSPSGQAEPELVKAIQDCEQQGVLVIAAAGNGGCGSQHACDCMHVPGAIPSVLVVGAMDDLGQPMDFSNCGSGYQEHGLLAPGKDIPGAAPGSSTTASTGTSFATPIVAGVAGLLMSLQRKQGSKPDCGAVRDALLNSADPCDSKDDSDCRRILAGRLNLTKTVSFITQGVTSMTLAPSTIDSSACGCKAAPDAKATEQTEHKVLDESNGSSDTTAGDVTHSTAINRVARELSTDRPRPVSKSSVHPAACLSETKGQLVYAIGNLSYDFGTSGNRISLDNSIASPQGFPDDLPLTVSDSFGLLAYLLGYRMLRDPNAKTGQDNFWEICGSLHDAAYIYWVLTQDACPKYVIRPLGAYTEAAYLEFIRFLIEQNGFRQFLYMPGCDNARQAWCPIGGQMFQLRGDCLKQYYCCHGGEVCPCEAIREGVLPPSPGTSSPPEEQPKGESGSKGSHKEQQSSARHKGAVQSAPFSFGELAALTGSTLSTADYIAVAGEICGTATLYNGQTVPTVSPALRSCATWNTAALIQAAQAKLGPQLTPEQVLILFALSRTLSEQTRNDGRTPEDRAFNYAAVTVIANFAALINNPVFTRLLGLDPNDPASVLAVGFDSWTVQPAPCREPDTQPYDVNLIFYNTDELLPSRIFVTYTVNVADVNPVAGSFRLSIRR